MIRKVFSQCSSLWTLCRNNTVPHILNPVPTLDMSSDDFADVLLPAVMMFFAADGRRLESGDDGSALFSRRGVSSGRDFGRTSGCVSDTLRSSGMPSWSRSVRTWVKPSFSVSLYAVRKVVKPVQRSHTSRFWLPGELMLGPCLICSGIFAILRGVLQSRRLREATKLKTLPIGPEVVPFGGYLIGF